VQSYRASVPDCCTGVRITCTQAVLPPPTDVPASGPSEGHGYHHRCLLLSPHPVRGGERMLLLPATIRRRKSSAAAAACPVRFEKDAAVRKQSKTSAVIESASSVVTAQLIRRRQSLDEGRLLGGGGSGGGGRRLSQLKTAMRRVSVRSSGEKLRQSVVPAAKSEPQNKHRSETKSETLEPRQAAAVALVDEERSVLEVNPVDIKKSTLSKPGKGAKSSLPKVVKQALSASVMKRSKSVSGSRAEEKTSAYERFGPPKRPLFGTGAAKPPSSSGKQTSLASYRDIGELTRESRGKARTGAGSGCPPSIPLRKTGAQASAVVAPAAGGGPLVRKCGSYSSLDSGIFSPSTELGRSYLYPFTSVFPETGGGGGHHQQNIDKK
jgi:hypothetical protein